MKTFTFHVHGMHCNSCVLLTESEFGALPMVVRVKTNLKHHTVEIAGNFGDMTELEIAELLTSKVKDHGYTVSLEQAKKSILWSEFCIAIPVALLFVAFFVLIQKLGIINLAGGGSMGYGAAFMVGVVASLSTCMAVVGGLVLSMSATFAKEGDRLRPQIMFHAGRLISFFVLGGVVGAIGSAFALSTTATFILGILVAVIMFILGINLLDVLPSAKRFQPSMPKFIARHAHGISTVNHTLTPFLVGIATFFLPCGFTQSMQFYTLTTGSFMVGALTMFSFALGTLPVLALISLSSFSIRDSKYAGAFFKSAGLIVILFALFNLINSLVIVGLIPPIFNF